MLTSYAKQFAYLFLCAACICGTVWALGFAFDLYAMGWGLWVFALPGVCFLGAGLSAMKAEQHEADEVPPCLVHYVTRKAPDPLPPAITRLPGR